MKKHPLIATLETAGEMSRTVARNLQASNYTVAPDGIVPDTRHAMALLADALVQDATGEDQLHDFYRLDDRTYPAAGKAIARERVAQRRKITNTLSDFPRPVRVALIDGLAAGKGADVAAGLLRAVDIQWSAIEASLTREAFGAAATA